MRKPESKIYDLPALLKWREELRSQGRKLVVTNGCFDIMHRGHAQYLFNARQCGDALLVLVNGDDSIQKLKGPDRPVIPEANRLYMLASLECIDALVVFNEPRATKWFEQIQPDIYVKGADYTEETLDREEYGALKTAGASFEFLEFVPGCSTTNIIERIKSTC